MGQYNFTTPGSLGGTCAAGELAADNTGKIYYCSNTDTWTDLTADADTTYTFENGLTNAPAGTVKLGGALTADTSITQSSAQILSFINNGTGNTLFNLT